MKKHVVLGISSSHGDSSAAVIVDGRIVAAVEEERFDRIKHSAEFPHQAIKHCLDTAGLKASDVDVVTLPRSPSAAMLRKLRFAWAGRSTAKGLANYLERQRNRRSDVEALAELGFDDPRIVRVEHHSAHLMSARMLNPRADMALLSFDGLGDFTSAALAVAHGDRLRVLRRTYFPHSLGYFYTAMTQFLGFPHFGDEFKVMGLSSFGRPRFLDAMHQLVKTTPKGGFELNLEAFPVALLGTSFKIDRGRPVVKPIFDQTVVERIVGVKARQAGEPVRAEHEDLALSIQRRFEEVAAHMLNDLHARTGLRVLGLAGGCAHNSVFVGKIRQLTPFQEVFVSPAAGDAGLALGAAAMVNGGVVTPASGHWGLLGPDIDLDQDRWVDVKIATRQRQYEDDASLIERMVDELVQGKVLGLARGPMEFGPRALGSRSILCDPRHEWMKGRVNSLVKHRESFRPFAASVLAERQDEWFEHCQFSPFMEAVFPVKDAQRSKIPAVVHADGSCRIQSVTPESQPFYHALITAFAKRTGVPMLLNTSFNDSEPIVRTASEAIDCFVRGSIDHVVVGRVMISRDEAVTWGVA